VTRLNKEDNTITYQPDFTLPGDLLEQIASQGLDFIPELVRILVNAAMRAERENILGAVPYQRSDQRQGQANDYKPNTV
jgi:transposase-like protein